ncbi:hypothetical protein [Klebsiella quasipneumoniae]|uniref:hypothetical protein n=1 Tax=Klebsiella quasipneumoniae TaxID=1463165 RepID=UPI00237C6D40|nr:hypothetical protein [Klebsiella quasipneumoniae]MDE1584174.1 hypothetical protein [Klebsiella quasipneumoniae]MDE1593850.1 hypothetical protein [Klebsiella quasipneumoniae]MDE1599197.1 hypothetical protein [Klebsiella quasipneumoniae]MDE1604557.1 hypothetical protein [Klebsiella quasipneumoniae]MDE1609908.1 hypothetical protein [Klebsiella quasipneumoniae]
MPFYLTGNPVPSASVLDIRDNSQNLDLALNDITSSLWADRLGRNRMTWYGMESAFTVKLSDFELRFISQITEQETAFDVAQADKESRFTTQLDGQDARFDAFIASSGYDIIGDYTVGTIPEGNPLAITEYNQLIRYNNELYKLTSATDIPFTTAGNTDETWISTDSAHFVSVGDAALRQNLGSDDGFKLLGQCPSYAALKNVIPDHEGQTIRLSSYYSGWENTALGIPYGRGEYVAIPATGLIDDGGFTCIPIHGGDLAWRLVVTDNLLPLENFGCIPDTTRFTDGTDCTSGMNACFATAVKYGLGVRGISTGQSTRNSTTFYLVSAPIIATGVHVIEGDIHLKVHSSTFDKTSYDYVFLLGDHNTNFTTIQNTLRFNTIYVYDADQRTIELNGIYLKYTNAHGTVLRGHYLNGHGVHVSPTYDSVFGIWSEVCGSVTKFAIRWDDNGDITNQLTIPDLLCHDSYHFGLGLFGNKCTINRIHLEGTYTLTNKDFYQSWANQPFMDGIQFANHIISVPALHVGQINVFDSGKSTTAEGVPTLNQTLGTHLVIAGARGSVVSSISNSGMLNKTSFVSTGPNLDSKTPYPQLRVNSLQCDAAYILNASRISLNGVEISRYLKTQSPYSEINYGYIEELPNAGGALYTNVVINKPYSAIENGLLTPVFNSCKLNEGISKLNTGMSSFNNCTIASITLNATDTPEVAIFSRCRVNGNIIQSDAPNSLYYKNITYEGCYFGGNINCPENASNIYSSVKFIGTSNTKAPEAAVIGWALPTASISNGMIVQRIGNPSSGQGVVFIYTADGWKEMFSV